MKIAAIVGTNADLSYNRKLLHYMARHFAAKAQIEVLEIRDLPLFNENSTKQLPQSVADISRRISNSDAVIIATPEYNHSIPSPLKSLLDWLSCTSHAFAKKPTMIVGASYGTQGTSRAQMHLRQILDSPGVESYVMPGDEFLLANCATAFDDQDQLTDQDTITFLEKCFTDFQAFVMDISGSHNHEKEDEKQMKVDQIQWDYTYDTVVLGFGGAGATAARFAADAGAQVLLADAAPKGHEGGNTRYSAQLIGTGDDFDETKKYYKNLTYPMALDEDMIDTFVEGMVNMRDYVRNYLGVEPVSVKNEFDDPNDGMQQMIKQAAFEFPEYAGVNSYDFTVVHKGTFDAALWRNLRKQVTDRADKIDVWLSSPAVHLLQDTESKTIIGVQIQRNHILVNVRALNGVVLSVGGFENDKQAVQDYLGAEHLAPLGTLFNKGDGIRMAEEVGADLWHMQNYEALGMLHGLALAVPEGERGRLILGWQDASNGSVITVADDGSRYFDESEPNRHGHIYDHGTWRIPRTNVHPYLIFDQTQFEQIKQNGAPVSDFFDKVVKAHAIEDLAQIIKADPAILQQTITDFDRFAKNGRDYAFDRAPESMRAFDEGPYYAVALTNDVLNTQGGPRRNARAEILDTKHQPIPHLYGAGELGGINANQYQGGGNLAECLIFGKIAGENAARPKNDFDFGDTAVTSVQAKQTQASGGSDLSDDNDLSNITVGKDQYLGVSEAGIGGKVVVRITYADDQLKDVEVVEQSESGDVGGEAIATLPGKMVAANTYDVDAVSGASASSNAIKSAVKDALSKVKSTVA